MHQLPVVLIVAKDRERRTSIASHIQTEGYLLLTAHDATSAIEAAECNTVALALVDMTTPSWRDGLAVRQILRRNDFRALDDRTGAIPLLVIVSPDTPLGTIRVLESSGRPDPGKGMKEKTQTAERDTGTVQSHDQALELTEEECIAMPFAWASLRARIRLALEASVGARLVSHELYPGSLEEGILTAGELRVDLARREVTKGSSTIDYRKPRLFDLLVYFVRNQGVALTQGQLMTNVWGYLPSAKSRTLHVHICWLRDLIEDDSAHPTLIQTVQHVGYRFVAPA